ncbi:MAG TPA: FAD-dependent thymidylate synthase [Candidatus Nanoarchaeia archaeon]|nr:FAD-dependent thymidylate synthase [Candidatus Nanoarchaeia archaeon]
MLSTKDLKINFLGINPIIKDETGGLDPQSICALGALMTFKGASAENLKKEALEKGQDLAKKVKTILKNSSLKGHASMATTPVFSFSYESSKFLDSALTGMVFSSSLMASGRRTDSTADDIVYPTSILENKNALELYREISEKILAVNHEILEAGVEKDQASKILQYGIYGTGIISYSVESFNSLKREYEREKEWMPEEIGFLIKAFEKEFVKMGVDQLFATRSVAPRTAYPYPNIFKNPATDNLAREMGKKYLANSESEVIYLHSLATADLKSRMNSLRQDLEKIYQDKKSLIKNWSAVLEKRAEIARDYQNVLDIKTVSRLSWRVWGDKKRHRTMPMTVDSVYHSIDRTLAVWKKSTKKIAAADLTEKEINELDNVFSIPPAVKADKIILQKYLVTALDSLLAFEKLIGLGIPPRDAVFVIPRGIRIDHVQDINFYNLINGYYPIRLCTTAEEQLRRVSYREAEMIKMKLKDEKMDWLGWHIGPKCFHTGFCPEKNSCGIVKKEVKFYDDKFHEEVKNNLEDRFENNLNK